jgi:uncharacterized surface protein with fasciclin (FAS1) repeats
MMIVTRSFGFLFLGLAAFLNNNNVVHGKKVVGVIRDEPRLNTLESLIKSVDGLAATINSFERVTIFAPINSAFRRVDVGEELVPEILQYHVVRSGVFDSSQIRDGLTLPTVQGERLTFTVNSTGAFINGVSRIVQTDLGASNGVVHMIGNSPLIPKAVRDILEQERPVPAPVPAPAPTPTLGNVVDVAVSLAPSGFQTLVDLVVLAGLDSALASLSTVTVLAPTDDAFAELDPALVAALTTEPWRLHLQEILLYHCVETILRTPILLNSYTVNSRGGLYLTSMHPDKELLQFKSTDGTTININNGEANIIVADVSASNGFIHAIDSVLLPSFVDKTVVTVIVKDWYLRTLEALVIQAGLAEALSGPGPFTVFAPTNKAFQEAVGDNPSFDVETLRSILTYHVVPGMYPSSAIVDGLELETLQGDTITFSVTNEGVSVNGSPIEVVDILAVNGIVHKIGGVLLP